MATKISKNINLIDDADFTKVTLNSTTATTILVANDKRIGVVIYNTGTPDLFIKDQAASVDDLQEGHNVGCGEAYEIEGDVYTGEISGMTDGVDVEVHVYQYVRD